MLVTGAFLLLFGALCSVEALDNGLALTPPMGWNTIHAFGCNRDCGDTYGCVSETQMKRTADLLVSEGYLAAGYEYLVLDGCWDKDGRGVPDPSRFPNGMKALADYIHGKGLKFGILGDIDVMSELDASVAASWGVDFFAAMGYNGASVSEGYIALSQEINSTSRPMIVACSWPYLERLLGTQPNYEVASQYCNTWRIDRDIDKSWSTVVNIYNWVGDHQEDFASLSGPGHWNDPDRLIIGNPELTVEQAQIHMALWSIMAAPLIMSVDLAKVKPEYKDILLNRDIIAVDQDKLGLQGKRVHKKDSFEVWTRKLSEECYAVAFVNLGNENEAEIFDLTHEEMKLPQQTYVVKDLYHNEKEKLLRENENFTVSIVETGVKFYKFVPY